jgi:hypothetical protein
MATQIEKSTFRINDLQTKLNNEKIRLKKLKQKEQVVQKKERQQWLQLLGEIIENRLKKEFPESYKTGMEKDELLKLIAMLGVDV